MRKSSVLMRDPFLMRKVPVILWHATEQESFEMTIKSIRGR
jgi:hypothetical protein